MNRIDAGRFAPLWRDDQSTIELTLSELLLFLDGSKLVGKIALAPKPIDRKAQSRVSPPRRIPLIARTSEPQIRKVAACA